MFSRNEASVLAFSFLLFAAPACQNKPAFDSSSQQEASSPKSETERDDWWNNQIQQEAIESSDVQNDSKVQIVVEKIKTDPYVGCGYAAGENPDTVEINPINLNNVRSKIVSDGVTVLGNGSISFSGKQSGITAANTFNVTSTSPNNAVGRATKLATKGSGKTTFQNITQALVQTALNTPAAKPFCGIVMSKSLRSQSADGLTYVEATFDKPIVTLINPKVSVERIRLQLINPIKITGVTATLVSNDADVNASGTVKRGDIEVALIPTTRQVMDSFGQPINITSEVAYRIANKFQNTDGTTSGTPSLLDQVADYYVSGNKITHIVVLSPLPELPVIVYQAGT